MKKERGWINGLISMVLVIGCACQDASLDSVARRQICEQIHKR